MKVSIIVPVLNSHEIVRRQLIHFRNMFLPDDVEIIYVDDGSEPPLEYPKRRPRYFYILPTHDKRPWTWAVARNTGAKQARGEYLIMTDLDYIIPKKLIEDVQQFNGDYMGFRREFGVLDENGIFTQDLDTLLLYGLPPQRYAERGTNLPAHPNNFAIRKALFFEMGGYREDLIGREYPQGEDGDWKRKRKRWAIEGKLEEAKYRPCIYMFPNGRWCGDVDHNPFNLFHNLSRKSNRNPWVEKKADGSIGAYTSS